jgi:hypothetical protein
MNRIRKVFLAASAVFALAGHGLAAAAPALTGFPFTDETLTYSVTWPSGLALGEAHLHAGKAATGWNFGLAIDAGVPGFDVKDNYTSRANADFCSIEFAKQFVHGPRKGGEKETIDRSHATVTRTTTNGGGKSEFSVPDCTKDALTLLYYARREMGQGRVPPAQQILFGGLYDSSLQYTGEETVQIAGRPVVTDKVVCDLKGPSSTLRFEIYFARDPARTPLRFQVPLAMGKFSMELVR